MSTSITRGAAASIHWGDGSNTGAGAIVKGPDGTFVVSAEHPYAEEGDFTATVDWGDGPRGAPEP